MDYDFRNRASSMYSRQPPAGSGGGPPSLYPRVGQPPPPPARQAPSSSPSSGLGIRVSIKPEYRITPPPPLAPQVGEIPRSTFQFDFDFEKKILAEAEKDSQNWSRLAAENLPSKTMSSTSSMVSSFPQLNISKDQANINGMVGRSKLEKTHAYGSHQGPVGDPVVNKYVASGLGREAVSLAVLNYGDNPIKVREFVKGFNLLREMGFSSENVAEMLAMYDNDANRALSYFLNNKS